MKKKHFVVVVYNKSKTPSYIFLTSKNISVHFLLKNTTKLFIFLEQLSLQNDINEDERRTEMTRLIHTLVTERLIPFIQSNRNTIEREVQHKKAQHSNLSFVMNGKIINSTGTVPRSEVYFAETGTNSKINSLN
jgi:hypothetical protein